MSDNKEITPYFIRQQIEVMVSAEIICNREIAAARKKEKNTKSRCYNALLGRGVDKKTIKKMLADMRLLHAAHVKKR